jgi:uncharacterized protein (TIGR03083 family)
MAELARTDLDADVPTCPDWKVRDLIEHTGFVHRWQTAAVRERTESFPPEETWRFPPADGESFADWFQAGVDEAVRALGTVEPGEPRWTWYPGDQTAGWYHRRITQETLVHRIDAELAAADPVSPIDPELAVDGIEEILFMFIPASGDEPVEGNGETLHLHATDAEGEWTLTLRPTRIEVARGHAKGDCAVRGSAADLLLFSWGRDALGDVEVFGDASIRDRVFALAKT